MEERVKKYGEQERLEHIKNWKKGTLSQTAYAKSAGIIPTTFFTWTKEKKEKKKEKGEESFAVVISPTA